MNEVFMAYDRWGGLITILFGTYATLLAYGYLPRNPKDPEKLLLWRKKFGGMMQVLGPFLIFAGIVTLVMGLSSTPVNPATKRVFAEFYRANEARVARGTSLQSAELFVADLKRIDLSQAPAELRAAMQDYTNGLADGLISFKAGKPNTAANSKMADAKQRLERIETNLKR